MRLGAHRQIVAERLAGVGVEGHHPILAALARAHHELALALAERHVGEAQRDELADADARVAEHLQDGEIPLVAALLDFPDEAIHIFLGERLGSARASSGCP